MSLRLLLDLLIYHFKKCNARKDGGVSPSGRPKGSLLGTLTREEWVVQLRRFLDWVARDGSRQPFLFHLLRRASISRIAKASARAVNATTSSTSSFPLRAARQGLPGWFVHEVSSLDALKITHFKGICTPSVLKNRLKGDRFWFPQAEGPPGSLPGTLTREGLTGRIEKV